MTGLLDEALERYAERHTTAPDPALSALAQETRRSLRSPGMLTGPVEGRLLEMLVYALQPSLVLEIGTFSGYSALSMAAALAPGARLVTCEISPAHAQLAASHIAASPLADRIDLRLGPALDTIEDLPGPFDLVFIDAEKTAYVDYYEATLPKLSRRGLMVADNTLWGGRVLEADAADASAETRALAAFNERVLADPRVICALLTVRDGITLIRWAS